jgi:hypothetical protein
VFPGKFIDVVSVAFNQVQDSFLSSLFMFPLHFIQAREYCAKQKQLLWSLEPEQEL